MPIRSESSFLLSVNDHDHDPSRRARRCSTPKSQARPGPAPATVRSKCIEGEGEICCDDPGRRAPELCEWEAVVGGKQFAEGTFELDLTFFIHLV